MNKRWGSIRACLKGGLKDWLLDWPINELLGGLLFESVGGSESLQAGSSLK